MTIYVIQDYVRDLLLHQYSGGAKMMELIANLPPDFLAERENISIFDELLKAIEQSEDMGILKYSCPLVEVRRMKYFVYLKGWHEILNRQHLWYYINYLRTNARLHVRRCYRWFLETWAPLLAANGWMGIYSSQCLAVEMEEANGETDWEYGETERKIKGK